MKWLLALLLLLNLVLYLLWGPYDLALPQAVAPGNDAAGKGLTLLAEVDRARLSPPRESPPAPTAAAARGPAEAPPALPQQPAEAAPAPALRGTRVAICYTVGTLQDRLLADRVAQELRRAGIRATLRAEERRGDLSGYWVLLPQQAGQAEAQALVGKLQERGIDSFVVSAGEYRNAVSLGFFHGRDLAEQLETRIRALGFSPRLVLRYRRETLYWVDLDEAQSERLGDGEWKTLADAYPMLGRYVRDCS